ncbi:enoyl-CoA hydratase/isomerase family protein [Palleronia sp. KMU-117]|uniref:enoyl-CoA hydratase/isomerase family protein n=1 Tax=Palleronia sp. KMU-117 TaxID=3434108 RepID=UPI003D7575A2
MSDVLIRTEGRAGRITLNRPQALNAVTHGMCRDIEAALVAWRDDPAVALVLIDAAGARAFSAGGDIAEMYATGRAGDFAYGRRFWRDEYRLNARIFEYAKPVVSFLQGFTMGGGVGIGCHARLRIVGETSQIAMPECGIGLVPDVGGSMMLARAPGRIGAWLGTTGARMGPADAILAGFADAFLPEARWDAVKAAMIATGRPDLSPVPPPPGRLADLRGAIDRHFAADDLGAILAGLAADGGDVARETLAALRRNAPLSVAATLEMLRRLGPSPDIREALALEYRFTYRAMEQGDFLEGIRAAIIDKDRRPRWRHDAPPDPDEVAAMLAPLGPDELTLGEATQ